MKILLNFLVVFILGMCGLRFFGVMDNKEFLNILLIISLMYSVN